ncbi:MAG TPA: cation diffusion facilitator family transporter [Desulfobacterales bacterium]|nr:cation diffusion facilitator family transporter [Desulfobacterales bacterium]
MVHFSANPDTHEHPGRRSNETGQILRVAVYAFLINIGLAAVKTLIAVVSGSLAITAGAIDSATDAVSSLVVIGGLKLSIRKSESFPYGLYKIENVISVIIAIFIFFAGFEIVREAFSATDQPPSITLGFLGWLSVGVLITFLFGRYAIKVGRRTESPTLVAEGRHRQVDVVSSLVVLLSVLLNYFNITIEVFGIPIDHLAAGIVVIFIARAGWELLSDGMRVLLDASIDPGTLATVRKIIESEPMVTEIRWLTGRNAGRFCFLETDVVMRTGDLEKADQISRHIESEIRKQVPHIERVVIHYKPRPREYMNIALPLADTTGKVSEHFGEAPYFSITRLRVADGGIERQEVVANPHAQLPKAKGIRVAEWLVRQKVDVVGVKEDLRNKGPAYVFADAGVEVHVIKNDRLSEAIDSLPK